MYIWPILFEDHVHPHLITNSTTPLLKTLNLLSIMSTSIFMVKFQRKDGLSMTSVYEESWSDSGVFEMTVGVQGGVFSFVNEEMVDKINDIMEESYDRHDVDYLPTRWNTINGNEDEAKLFIYTFFQRMGRDPSNGETFTGTYHDEIRAWEMSQMCLN